MRIRTIITIIVVPILVVLGWFMLQDASTKPMGSEIVAAGYPAEQLSNLVCGDRSGSYDCTSLLRTTEDPVGLNNDEVISLVFRPENAPAHCEYKFTRTFSPISGSWVFALNRTDANPPLGAKGYNNGALWDGNIASAEKPSPSALWQFAQDHLTGIDTACKPANA